MGLSSSKKKTTNDPAAWAKQPILDSLADTRATYQANQPALQNFATQQQATYGRLAPGAEQGILSAQALVNRNLSGQSITENPFLEGVIGKTRSDITNNVNSQFSSAGRYGSGMHADILTRELADAENQLRYQDYATERGYQQDAIPQAQNLMGGATGLLNNAAELPWVGVRAQNGGVSGLTNGYGTQTTKSSGSVLDGITQAVGIASKAASLFSDERLKDDKKKIGTLPDGLDVFQFTYKGDPTDTPQTGLMAQQVEKKYPEAVETDPASGFKKVDYSAVPDAESIAPAMQPVNPGMFGTKKIKRSFDAPGGTGEKLGALGDFLLAVSGNQAGLLGMQQSAIAKREAQQAALEEQRFQSHHSLLRSEALEDYERKRNEPRYFSGKEDQLSYDPATGSVSTIYDAPEEYETYANALGYQPGSPEYRGALTDYVLRGYGPTAAGVRSDLQSQRLEGQTSLEGLRQRNRLALKQTPGARPRGNGYGHSGGTVGTPRTTGNVYAPILDKVARGIPLSAGEQKVLEMRGGRRSAGSSTAPTATGPGGKKVQWNGSAWVPVN